MVHISNEKLQHLQERVAECSGATLYLSAFSCMYVCTVWAEEHTVGVLYAYAYTQLVYVHMHIVHSRAMCGCESTHTYIYIYIYTERKEIMGSNLYYCHFIWNMFYVCWFKNKVIYTHTHMFLLLLLLLSINSSRLTQDFKQLLYKIYIYLTQKHFFNIFY